MEFYHSMGSDGQLVTTITIKLYTGFSDAVHLISTGLCMSAFGTIL